MKTLLAITLLLSTHVVAADAYKEEERQPSCNPQGFVASAPIPISQQKQPLYPQTDAPTTNGWEQLRRHQESREVGSRERQTHGQTYGHPPQTHAHSYPEQYYPAPITHMPRASAPPFCIQSVTTTLPLSNCAHLPHVKTARKRIHDLKKNVATLQNRLTEEEEKLLAYEKSMEETDKSSRSRRLSLKGIGKSSQTKAAEALVAKEKEKQRKLQEQAGEILKIAAVATICNEKLTTTMQASQDALKEEVQTYGFTFNPGEEEL